MTERAAQEVRGSPVCACGTGHAIFATAQQFGRIWSEADINHRAGWPLRVVPDAYPAWRPGHRHSYSGRGLRDAGSLQVVHSLSGGQRPRTSNSISLFIETLGTCQGRRECGFRLLLGASDRGRRRLAIELCANRLRRHRPGVRIARGLAHRLLELRDPAAARTGMRYRGAEAQGGGNKQGCRKSADGSTAHLRASP